MSRTDRIQVQGNAVYVNGVTFGTCEKYKGKVRLWLHDRSGRALPSYFTILENTPDALKNFIAAYRQVKNTAK